MPLLEMATFVHEVICRLERLFQPSLCLVDRQCQTRRQRQRLNRRTLRRVRPRRSRVRSSTNMLSQGAAAADIVHSPRDRRWQLQQRSLLQNLYTAGQRAFNQVALRLLCDSGATVAGISLPGGSQLAQLIVALQAAWHSVKQISSYTEEAISAVTAQHMQTSAAMNLLDTDAIIKELNDVMVDYILQDDKASVASHSISQLLLSNQQ